MTELSQSLVERLSSLNPGQPCRQQVILEEIRRVILAGEAPPGTPIPLEADIEDGNRPGVTAAESTEVRELRKRNRLLVDDSSVAHGPRGTRHALGHRWAIPLPAHRSCHTSQNVTPSNTGSNAG